MSWPAWDRRLPWQISDHCQILGTRPVAKLVKIFGAEYSDLIDKKPVEAVAGLPAVSGVPGLRSPGVEAGQGLLRSSIISKNLKFNLVESETDERGTHR